MFYKLFYNRLPLFGFLIALVSLPMQLQAQDWIYTTVEGDNLWNLSEKHLDRVTRFEQLRKINQIDTPKLLQPGTKLRIPLKWIRSNPASAEIISIQGTAELQRTDGTVEQILVSGKLIHLGDRLKSGTDSSVAIKFADNTILTLYSNSVIYFDHLSAHGVTGMVDSRLHLLKGRLDTRVTPAVGPGSRFEIQTPSAISAVRGTEYRALVASEEESSNIEVLFGKVDVSGENKKTLIKSGFGTQVIKGKPPLPPRKLLKPPELKSLPERIRSINWFVSWGAVDRAIQYRFEISADEQFNTVLWQQLDKYQRAALPNLLDGNYFIRVRGVDELGLEGISTVSPIVIDAHPQPPVQLKPAEGQVFRGKSPELQWTASADAQSYRLEVSSDPQFKQILVVHDDIDKTRFNTDKLPEIGKYHWRLTSIAPDGEYGPVGTVRSYEIKPIPDKVEANMDAADDGKLVASWKVGSGGQSYQIQLANDQEFNSLEFDHHTSEATFSFEPVRGQVRYLRIRVIEADGYLGPWGVVQRVDPLPNNRALLILAISFLSLLLL